MTRILVQRGSSSSSSSSNQNRSSSSSSSQAGVAEVVPSVKDLCLLEDQVQVLTVVDESIETNSEENLNIDNQNGERKSEDDVVGPRKLVKVLGELPIVGGENNGVVGPIGDTLHTVTRSTCPSPPPVPPPKPLSNSGRFNIKEDSNAVRIELSSRMRGTSPRSHCEGEGYNSADEQGLCFGSSYDDSEREHQFEVDLRRVKGLEVRKMVEDGNCLFRAVADQVYGDSELYDLVRQLCIDYMERERDHFLQFITEGFTSYCKRKRRDKVYGNNMEIQALSEMYNRPIHIYSYSTEPINIFHGSYSTDMPPIRLSYHRGNHYNSLIDPHRTSIGAGLGFSSLQGKTVDKDQVKAAIKAQQDQQINNALLAEGRFYSDLELTEKEIERMVIEASRTEYLAEDKFKPQLGQKESTSRAEPSSSAASGAREFSSTGSVVNSSSMQVMLSMGFSYLQVVEAYSIFGDDVDSMVCYLVETSGNGRCKGKATE